ncbi:MAG: alpha/beta hydrolase-fold protein [Planctomycetaceae bacterium]
MLSGVWCWVCIATAGIVVAAEETQQVSAGKADPQGVIVHQVESSYQAGTTDIRVLLPPQPVVGKRYPVIYLLPVEAGRESRYGDGMTEVLKQQLHHRHDAIFVAPSFSQLPWYADHPTEPAIRQESYFLDVVIPYIERTYPASAQGSDRLLVGFSKSGWGAWTLLLRHPETFGRAVAWDAPLMMPDLGLYGNKPIFATSDNFQKYRVTDLLKKRAELLKKTSQDSPRLILAGYGNFQKHHEQAHDLLEELEIPHVELTTPPRPHNWHSGWLPEALPHLLPTTEVP